MTLFNDTSLFTSGMRKTELFELEDASLIHIESFLLERKQTEGRGSEDEVIRRGSLSYLADNIKLI